MFLMVSTLFNEDSQMLHELPCLVMITHRYVVLTLLLFSKWRCWFLMKCGRKIDLPFYTFYQHILHVSLLLCPENLFNI